MTTPTPRQPTHRLYIVNGDDRQARSIFEKVYSRRTLKEVNLEKKTDAYRAVKMSFIWGGLKSKGYISSYTLNSSRILVS